MRALVVGLGLVCGCATSPAVDVAEQGVTSEPGVSTDAASTNVESLAPVSSFSASSEATSEPSASSSVGVETSSAETSAAPSTGASSSEPATSTEIATSETSAPTSAVTSDATTEVDAPELTMANVVEVMTALGVNGDNLSGFNFRMFPKDYGFRAIHNTEADPEVPLFDPPLVEWVEGCQYLQAVIRVPVGMCLTVSGDLKTVGQYPETSACEPDAVNIPSCANAEDRLSRTQSPNLEPDHTETLLVRAFAYSAEQCTPDAAPYWSATLYKGACTTD